MKTLLGAAFVQTERDGIVNQEQRNARGRLAAQDIADRGDQQEAPRENRQGGSFILEYLRRCDKEARVGREIQYREAAPEERPRNQSAMRPLPQAVAKRYQSQRIANGNLIGRFKLLVTNGGRATQHQRCRGQNRGDPAQPDASYPRLERLAFLASQSAAHPFAQSVH